MKSTIGAVILAVIPACAFLCGCAGRTTAPVAVREPSARGTSGLQAPMLLATTPDEPAARLPGLVITQRQFLAPLIEGHGLPVLLNVVQLELAKQNAQRKGLKLTDEDLRKQRDRMLEQAFSEADNKTEEKITAALAKGDRATAERLRQELKQDRERALEQLLAQRRVGRAEFDLVVQTGAYLRKLAEQEMREIPDEVVRKAFETEYGSTVRVRHIQATSREELARAQERLKAGESFEKVAREMSRNPRTAALGGELPKFSLATTNIPDNFKQAAFNLNEKQVSEIVFCDGAYHLIKLEEKFAPRAIKFESVKDSLRNKVREQIIQGAIDHYQDQLSEQVRNTLKIEDPVLREQFARRLEDRERQVKELTKANEELERERRQRREAPQNAPAAPGTATPAAAPAPTPAVDPQKVLPVPQPKPEAPKN